MEIINVNRGNRCRDLPSDYWFLADFSAKKEDEGGSQGCVKEMDELNQWVDDAHLRRVQKTQWGGGRGGQERPQGKVRFGQRSGEKGAKQMILAAAFCAATPGSCSCSLEILFMPQGVLESLKLTQF